MSTLLTHSPPFVVGRTCAIILLQSQLAGGVRSSVRSVRKVTTLLGIVLREESALGAVDWVTMF